MMYPNIKELSDNYLKILGSKQFKDEYRSLLKNYVGRPSPLFFASRLSSLYKAKIFLKREDLNHTGAHKINNTVGQILIAKSLGKTRIIAETGAGQHGVATATVCALMGLKCIVYMGQTDINRQTPNVLRMKMLGAEVVAVTSGNKTLKDATNEAIRDWISNPQDTYYIIGSVVGPHPYPDLVTRLQSVISEEMKVQVKEVSGKENPDYIIACVGGGSNAIGSFYHYLNDKKVRLIAVEAGGKGIGTDETAATMVKGRPGVIHGSMTMLMQNDDGQITEPYSISAGLDYPGIGPIHAYLHKKGRVVFEHVNDEEALEAAFRLTRLEGIVPALESAHALAFLEKMKFLADDVVIVTLSGRGDKDMSAYINCLNNKEGQ
jgi:tryptophan synthase beta chain